MCRLKRILFITGRPGVGKTSVLLRVVRELKNRGKKIGGMVSREVREGGRRVGFEIISLQNGRKGWLAHINQPTGPRVSKYRVNLEDLDLIGVKSILEASEKADIIVIDEVGPMELFSRRFREAVTQALRSGKIIIGTIHFKARDPLIEDIKSREDAEVLEVTEGNRANLHKLIISRLREFMEKT